MDSRDSLSAVRRSEWRPIMPGLSSRDGDDDDDDREEDEDEGTKEVYAEGEASTSTNKLLRFVLN